ncbi:MAG: helix-turn-helix domain-containing protein [Deinococcota bacterium]|nr:helix-turn-helix domain-containing protein [Deinococcota bacterium]
MRPRALTEHRLKLARRMLDAPDVSVTQVAKHFGVARSTLYRLLEVD